MRFIRINSDSPALPNKFRNVAPYKDEGAKAHESRNRALFGSWQPHPLDNYRFWSVQSPVWSYSLVLWFKAFGVSYASLRALSIVCALITLLAGAVALYRAGYRFGGLVFPVILGLNFYYVVFTRLGLMEPMVVLWMTLSAAFLAFARHNRVSYILATAFLLAAILAKSSAFLFFPVWAVFSVIFLWDRAVKPAGQRDWNSAAPVIGGAVVLLAGLGLFFSSGSYRDVTDLSVRHGFGLHGGLSMESILDLMSQLLSSFKPDALWRGYFLMLPSASLLGAGWIAYILWRAVNRKKVSDLEWICLGWFALGRAAAAAAPYQVVRFHLYYFAPLAMLASVAADRLWNLEGNPINNEGHGSRPAVFAGRAAVTALLAYELLMTAVPWHDWVAHPRYDIVEASRRLGAVLEKEEITTGRTPVVIGEWIGPLSLENRMNCHYVKDRFNGSRRQLEAFGITHLLESTTRYDPAVGRYKKQHPEIYAERTLVAEFPVRRRRLKLWRVPLVSVK